MLLRRFGNLAMEMDTRQNLRFCDLPARTRNSHLKGGITEIWGRSTGGQVIT